MIRRRIHQPKIERIPVTPEGFAKLQKEKEDLLSQRPEAVEQLKKARELGDLKENGYYKASRQKLNFIDGRLRRLEFMLKYALVIEGGSVESVDIGTTVTLKDGDQTFDYKIVGEEEADPREGKISFRSPLGHALLGKKEGEEVLLHAPVGEKIYKVVKLT